MRTTRVTPAATEYQFSTAHLVYGTVLSLVINDWYVVNLSIEGTLSRVRSISSEVLWGVINSDTSIVEVQEP